MDYTPIRISTIKPNKLVNFDLYIFFKEQYLKYRENGFKLEDMHLEKLKKQQIARFYITQEDEIKYQSFLDELLDEALMSGDVPLDEKVNLTEGTASTAIDQMGKYPASPSAYKMTQKAAKNLRLLVVENPTALKQIFQTRATDAEIIVRHCLSVSALCARMGLLYNMEEEDLDNLGIAALLHDIAIAHEDPNEIALFMKGENQLSGSENNLYKNHPNRAIEILEKNEFVNKKILDLIVSHEERLQGAGYPNKKTKLTLQEEILSLVNCFDKKVTVYGEAPKAALKKIQVDELGNFSQELINKFKQILKDDGLLDI